MSAPPLVDHLIHTLDHQPEALDAVLQSLAPGLSRAVVLELKRRVDEEKLRNAARAFTLAQLAQKVAEGLTDPVAMAWAHWATGNALAHLTHYLEALEFYRKAEVAFDPNSLQLAGLRVNRVAMLEELGEYAEAIAVAEETRQLCLDLGEVGEPSLAALEMNLGAAYEQQGMLDAALKAFERGRALVERARMEKGGSPIYVARLDVNCANVLKQMDRFEQAETLFLQAREVLASSGHAQELARVDLNLGRLQLRRGRYQRALEHLEAARQGFVGVPNPSEVAVVDLHRAMVYLQLNLLQESYALAHEAELRFEFEGIRWLNALALTVEGLTSMRLKRLDVAETRLRLARETFAARAPQRAMEVDLERAHVALSRGEIDNAETLAEQALHNLRAETFPTTAVRARLVLASVGLKATPPRLDQAIHHCTESGRLVEQFGLLELAPAVWFRHGQCQERLGALPDALQCYRLAVDANERLRSLLTLDELQLGFMDDKLDLYDALVRLYDRQGQAASVLLTLSQRAGTLPRAAAGYLPGEPDPDEAQLNALREAWHWQQSRLETAEVDPTAQGTSAEANSTRRKALEAALAELTRRRQVRALAQQRGLQPASAPHAPAPHAPARATAEPLPVLPLEPDPQRPMAILTRLQQTLRPDDRLIQLYSVPGRTGLPVLKALVLSPERLETRELPLDVPTLERWLQAWRFQMAHPEVAVRHAAQQKAQLLHLHRRIWQPLQPLLVGGGRCYVILPPLFHDLPLEAAFDGQHFRLELGEVVHLAQLQRLLEPPSPLEALSDPSSPARALVMGCSSDGRLQGTLPEAAQVAERLQTRGEVVLLLEEAATAEGFRTHASGASLLHLATHATFRDDNPGFSWIQLADARVTVSDIYQLSLSRRPLVVLSACETGRSQPRGGGLLGMGRALLAAGAAGLVLSRWQVADAATTRLMDAFYQHLRGQPVAGALSALPQAQRDAIAAGEPPLHWAAFLTMQ